MTKKEFVDRVFVLAKAKGLRVDAVTRGESRGLFRVWFNESSRKYLHELHLGALYATLKKRGLTRAQLNRAIDAVAPGSPCTHIGMREIYDQLHASGGFRSSDLKFSILVPTGAVMSVAVTKAQAESILDTATKLFDLVAEAKQIREGSPEAESLYGKIVYGALGEVMPKATLEAVFDHLRKPEVER